MAEVVEINDIESLASYHLDWSVLHRQTAGATFFNTLEWLQVYWKHHSQGKRLRVLIVRSGNSTIGIVPLIEKIEESRLGPIRVLTYPLEDWGSQFVPLGCAPTATLAVAIKHLANSSNQDWDMFEPRWVPKDNGRTNTAMQTAGLKSTTSKQLETSIIDYAQFEDWDSYLANQTYKSRSELRKRIRKVADEESGYRFCRYRPTPFREGGGDPNWELYDDCYRVAQKSWQANSPDGNTLSDPTVREFLKDAHEQAARLGMVDICLLYKNDEPVAYYYSYHNQGELIGLRTGYDPQASGAGSLLIASMLRDSLEQNDQRLDLGVGSMRYKVCYRTHTEESQKVTHISSGAWVPLAIHAARKIKKRFQSNKRIAAETTS